MRRVNGEPIEADNISVAQFLKDNGYRVGTIVVECNEVIVRKEQYEQHILHDGDVVEILNFVGGGW